MKYGPSDKIAHQNSKAPQIIVDDRERRSGIIELLNQKMLLVKTGRLRYGDFLIDPRWGIERKNAVDFNQSIIDGRLFRQIHRLKRFYSQPLLIIEGNPYQTHIHIDPNAVRGALLTLQAVWYLPTIYSRSIEDTCEILTTLVHYAFKSDNYMMGRAGYKPKRTRNRQVYFLCGLPGIGPTLAKRLLATFTTIENIIAAPADELARVDGIGHKTALSIRTLLEQPFF
ncbi:MAG: ERCC4 domain-containing protein [Desulfobacteraceae bacterium]|jgi:ERCC4-type nuclease